MFADSGEASEDASSMGVSSADSSSADSMSADEEGEESGPLLDLPDGTETGIPGSACEKVDVLFVIDDSWSMEDEQQNLYQSVPGFIQSMQTQLAEVDTYHVGVVTTDPEGYEYNLAPCTMRGAMVTKTGGDGASGETCGPYAEGYNYMTQEDDLGTAFQCAGLVGSSGDGDERPLDNLFAGLGPVLNQRGACNEYFLRDDALLVVVMITDEEDTYDEAGAFNNPPQTGSVGEPTIWFDDLVAMKGGVETNVVMLSLIGIPKPNDCGTLEDPDFQWDNFDGAEISNRLRSFTEKFTHGIVGDACTDDYAPYFTAALTVVETACNEFIPPG